MKGQFRKKQLSEIIDFVKPQGTTNHFSTHHQQWQNGLAIQAINAADSMMRLASTVMAERLLQLTWMLATSNVTLRTRSYGELIDVLLFHAFRCIWWMHLSSQREAKHPLRIQEASYLGI
jgi:hypothetical protein